ncbi:MAG: DUF4290 domain-containing protein [Saprospiraceae bacterium]|nr:MAG: DUF4290 domain-containing protein [Saprospiraceae bacterium]
MEYNSSKEFLIIPEYGRHVQNLINHIKEIENPDERQHFAERIIDLMMQMHPQNRNLEDYVDKLWRHLFQIANYELDVTPPGGVKPTPESSHKKPERVEYPSKDTRFRHYGSNVQKLIAKAISMEDGRKKDAFVQVIGSYMKLAYKTWNREYYVSDDIIIDDLEHLSGARLKLVEGSFLDNLSRGPIRQNRNVSSEGRAQRGSYSKSSGGRGNGGGGSSRGGARRNTRHKK